MGATFAMPWIPVPRGTVVREDGTVETMVAGGARWRRERDSNPRWAVNPHTLSRRAT